MIRCANAADLDQLTAIEQEAFPGSSWSASDFLTLRCLVAEQEGTVVGLLVSREIAPETPGRPAEREILNLAVRKAWRRKGIAALLLHHEMQDSAVFFLEVRESNAGAHALYTKCGFRNLSYRGNYYNNPREAAIVMTTLPGAS